LNRRRAPAATQLAARWVGRMADIDERAWNRLAGGQASPFYEWEWLRLLEASGSAVAENGWLPQHLTLWRGPTLVAAAPLYVKGHSMGEFVFDHAFADVAARLGIAYYPKLVGMSPFSPTIGYRFLIDPEEDVAERTRDLMVLIDDFCQRHRLGGCSFNYVDPDWGQALRRHGFLHWTHQSFAWRNRHFRTFEDYLAIFKTGQRRNIKRERRAMQARGLQLKPLTGDQIGAELFPHMYALYARTNARFGPWGCHFLTEEFFTGLHAKLRHRILLIAAYDGRRELPVGMSFLLYKDDRLYGRYWGATAQIDLLHFNACYYTPIEWAIAHGIRQFDPGIGGEHKIRRGFEAVPNFSYHRFTDPRMQEILRLNIGKINRMEAMQMAQINAARPLNSNVPGTVDPTT
jgi:predicted N-acyltransferase